MTVSTRLGQTTAELCEIPSVTGDEAALCDAVQARLGRLDPNRGQLVRHSHSLVLHPLRRPSVPLVYLAGHLDTVPPRQDQPVHIDGDWLSGCGASDMKSGLAVMLHLVEELAPADLGVDLGLVFYEREEGPYRENYLRVLLEREPQLHQADLCVCLEPTDNAVEMGCMGTLHATLTFEGRRAHSARPWQGHNAVHAAGPLLARLGAAEPRDVQLGPLVFREVMSITMVTGTGVRNVVPDRFEMNLNYRFAPDRSLASAQQEVLGLVGDDARVCFTDLSPSGAVCGSNPLARRLTELTEAPPRPKQAWTDVAQFTLNGIDAVNCGPGSGAQAHQRNEGVSVAAIARGYQLLRAWLAPV